MLFTSNTKVENKYSKWLINGHEISDAVHTVDRTRVPVKTSVKQ